MSQLFALEWDPREIRLMVASGRGRQIVIEQAFSIPCETDPSAADTAEQIGRRIAAELDARGLGRAETVVAVGRNSIELRQLQLPPAPDDDLPELVRFQATREFNELDDKWLLDFVPIEGSADSPRTVLATAIAPAILKQIEAVCQHAGLKMLRLLLRPCEAALLLEGEKSIPRGQVVLLVNPLGVEADLTAVVDGKAVFLRTTRIASDPPPLHALLAEIRLTMAAASNQLGGRRIESIVLCGDQQPDSDLARAISAELGIRVEPFDPFSGVTVGWTLVDSAPQHPGRYAPLLGMLLAELKPSKHAVDFLHPRRKPERADPRKKYMLAAGIAAAILFCWLIEKRVERYRLVSTVVELEQRSAALGDEITHAKQVSATAAEIAKWNNDDVIWLDRTYALAQSLPPAQNALLGQFQANSAQRGGQIDLKGFVYKVDDIASFEKSVREHGGETIDKQSREDHTVPHYNWAIDVSVIAAKADKSAKAEATDKTAPAEATDKTAKSETTDKAETTGKVDDKTDKSAKTDTADKSEKFDKGNRGGKRGKAAKTETTDSAPKSDKTTTVDKGDKSDKTGKGDKS
jgi:Tfp pilus assembly PilM family ATPase